MIYPEIPLPRLLDPENLGKTKRFIRPISVEINQKIVPLSYASMTLPQDESIPGRYYVELFTSTGSAGVYRVTSPQDAFGEDVITCELEHAITEVGDWLFGEEFQEMVPPHGAIERIWGHYRGNKWQLDAQSMTCLGTDKIALDLSYRNLLEGILGVLKQVPDCMMTFDFSVTPWKFGFAKKGTTVQAEGRLSRNVTSAKITYDDSSLCTRAFYQYSTTDSDGNSETNWTHKDADTISTYGIVERSVSTGSGYDEDEAEYVVDLYLAKHKKPLVSVSIEGLELSNITGEPLDKFEIGKKFRLALPDYDIGSVEDIITELFWKGLYSGFEQVTVNLGDQEDGVVTFLHDVDSSGGSSSGGRAGATQSQQNQSNWTAITRNDYEIRLEAYERVKYDDWNYAYINLTASYIRSEVGETANGLYSRIEQTASYIRSEVSNTANGLRTSITQTAASIRAEVSDTANGLRSSITTERNRISLVVEGTGSNAHVKGASIVTAINDQGDSHVDIEAKYINLNGYVTASQLNAQKARIDDLINGTTTADTISATNIKLYGYSLYRGTVTINGTQYNVVRWGLGD